MKVYVIEEESHGNIGIADSLQSAIKWLIKMDWISDDTEIYTDPCWNDIATTIENWRETIINYTLKQFNEIFDCCFYIKEEEVITDEENKKFLKNY